MLASKYGFLNKELQTLRSIFHSNKGEHCLENFLEQLKLAVKASPGLKDNLQQFVSFFMYCQSKHKPRDNQ